MTAPAAGSEGAPQGDPAGATPPNGDPNVAPAEGEPLGEGGIKALQAERARAEAAEARVKEFEKSQQDAERAKLSADERAKLEHTEANERATKAEQKLARLEVAIDKKLPAELAARLVGSTREELAADADALLALVSTLSGQAPPPPGGRPHEVLPSGGGDPTTPLSETDVNKIVASIPRRY
jgi:hypothetical protein